MGLFGFGKKKDLPLPDDEHDLYELMDQAKADGNNNLFFRCAQKLVNLDYGSHWELAECYANGTGVNKDLEKAKYYFQQAAEENTNSIGKYADLLYEGKYFPMDREKAIQLYLKGAEDEDVHSGYMVWKLYHDGLIDEEFSEDELAIMLFEAFADQEDGAEKLYRQFIEEHTAEAEMHYTHYVYNNIISEEHALESLKTAAAYGSKMGLYRLAHHYYSDEEESILGGKYTAKKYWEAGATLGDCEAMFAMALWYKKASWYEHDYRGDDLEQVINDWYEKAADAGHGGAANNLGVYYMNHRVLTKDRYKYEKIGLSWLERAAELGNTDAMRNLADYCDEQHLNRGYNPTYNHWRDQRIMWLEKAAELNDTKAMTSLGGLYKSDKQIDRALEMYQKAADLGDGTGYFYLGNYHEDKKDLETAAQMYQKAIDLGHEGSVYALERLTSIR